MIAIFKCYENFDDDDEFFHVTCHIDPGLRAKIERGEYIKLEKLLPKDRVSTGGHVNDDEHPNCLELVSQGAHHFIAPYCERTVRISGIRRWDQAFHIYAAVYTQANPLRSGEVWQYIHSIHTAAGSYSWECVAVYDYMFHKLMESKPWHSWGKTYTQGWNLALHSNHNSSQFSSGGSGQGNSGVALGKNKQDRSWKDNCCWRYNRNKCKRTGNDCNYQHRCTYCSGWNHGYFNCRKRSRKDERNVTNKQTSGGRIQC